MQSALGRIWREHYLSGGLDPTFAPYTSFYNAFTTHAKQILSESARLLEEPDTETYLAVLRARVIPSIVRWLEPELPCSEESSHLVFGDLTASGEWERWMERTYLSFRIDNPPPMEVELTVFSIYFQMRLRHAEHQQIFRRRIENGLNDEMIPIEAEVRKHPARIRKNMGPRTTSGAEMPAVDVPRRRINRAAWLTDRLKERGWDKHEVRRHGGPNYETVQKILDGFSVREDVLEKLACALSSKRAKVDVFDIPSD